MFFMVGSDMYSLREHIRRKRQQKAKDLPKFTVIIPAYNEAKTVLTSVSSVVSNGYPLGKLQVVVVDDGSKDNTFEVLENFKAQHNYANLILVRRKNAGKARALNFALEHYATGQLVMCLDADSSLEQGALREAAQYFQEDPRLVALAANVKIRPQGTLFNLIQQFEYIICYQMKRAQTIFNVEYIVGGIGSTFKRTALERVGNYDTNTITEDIDLTMKLLRLGNKEHRVGYGARVIAYTESVLNVKDLIKQRYRWKYGRTQTFLKNPGMFFNFSPKHSKMLTWFYLPFAIFCDLAFFLEPLMVSYILWIIVRYADLATLLSAVAVIAGYVMLNILAEDTIPWKQKIKLAALAPSMYFFFYLLSFVEYVALIKSLLNFRKIKQSVSGGEEICGWEHVARA